TDIRAMRDPRMFTRAQGRAKSAPDLLVDVLRTLASDERMRVNRRTTGEGAAGHWLRDVRQPTVDRCQRAGTGSAERLATGCVRCVTRAAERRGVWAPNVRWLEIPDPVASPARANSCDYGPLAQVTNSGSSGCVVARRDGVPSPRRLRRGGGSTKLGGSLSS